MVKRFRLWLKELSLGQQLTTLVFFAIALLTVFIFSVLTPRIEEVSNQEVYQLIHNSSSIYSYYLKQYPDDLNSQDESGVNNYVYVEDKDVFLPIGDLQPVSQDIQQEVISHLTETSYEIADFSIENKSEETLYYSLVRLDDNRILFSYVSEISSNKLQNLIVTQIVNMVMLISMGLFILLATWVTTLILPLNQIKQYIYKLKNDEPAVLTVNRRDEIGEVADALTEMQELLEKQNREKQEMIQNISHDLKTPIATIRSYSESIKDGIYPYGTLERSCDVINENADRLEKKVRSLIALNKMEYLLDDCQEGDHLPMAEVIEKVLLSLKVIRPEINFTQNIDAHVLFHGDEDPWRIVVENLIDNALRYAKSTIGIELSLGKLKIKNDGNKIEEDRLEKLFKPYEKGTDGQFGLGLSIVYRIVTTYGYKVEANNLPDGVEFCIWKELPKKEVKAYQRKKKVEEKELKK